MTQKDLIFTFLLKNPNARPIEISKALKIPAPSARRAIFNLRKEKVLSNPVKTGKNKGTVKIRKTKEARIFKELLEKIKPKPKPKPEPKPEPEPEDDVIIFKKTLGLTLYCCSKEVNWKAIIFDNFEFPDREDFLRDALIDFTIDDCGPIEKEILGYEVEEVIDNDEEIIGIARFERDD